ncbi:chromatin organization modifier domain-containing protein [Hirsutella rhossiliensis]
MSFGPPRAIPLAASKDLAERCNEGNEFVAKMQEITDLLRTNLLSAQASQEQFANANRSPAPAYRVGDMVLLSTRNIDSTRPIPKLDHKFIGPFRIERKGFQYHILWRGFDLEQATWEPLQNVVNAHIAIRDFEKHSKNKPRPTKQEVQNARLQAQQDVEESEAME